jgi:hypothetical protein
MKKIRIDFSKTEERSGWNTRQIPEGLHKMKVDGVQETEAQDGTAMLVYALVPADPKYKSRRFPYYCKLQQNQLWKLRDLLVAAGGSVPKKVQSIDPSAPVGKFIAAEVEDESNQQYAGRSVVQGTYGLDILDENGDDTVDDEDEEYEDEAEEAEDEYEDEDEGEDEEEEELETLTLPQLRKMAKELGIDTAGLKKDELIEAIQEEDDEDEDDEDEDDLDDEDLEDEDLEDEEFEDDEEEEEEPAPKRRATPARKPAAKAAPARKAAAPARRTVKRR